MQIWRGGGKSGMAKMTSLTIISKVRKGNSFLISILISLDAMISIIVNFTWSSMNVKHYAKCSVKYRSMEYNWWDSKRKHSLNTSYVQKSMPEIRNTKIKISGRSITTRKARNTHRTHMSQRLCVLCLPLSPQLLEKCLFHSR